MGRFVFRLQALLNLKKQMEEKKKNEYADAIKEAEIQKQLFARAQALYDSQIILLKESLNEGITLSEYRNIGVYLDYLHTEKKKKREILKKLELNVDKKREELIDALKEKEIFEKLRERSFKEYIKSQQNADQKQSDEIAGYKYSITFGDLRDGEY